jgi:hypothetical protein
VQGVLQGSSAELREIAAEGLGELVEVTSQEALRPFTVQITGGGLVLFQLSFWERRFFPVKAVSCLAVTLVEGPSCPRLHSLSQLRDAPL